MWYDPGMGDDRRVQADQRMRRFVDPLTGRLAMPPEPGLTEWQRHRQRWSLRLSSSVGALTVVTTTTSLALLPKPYDQLRLTSLLFALVLSVAVVGVGIWALRNEK
jgi:hypothetical protein